MPLQAGLHGQLAAHCQCTACLSALMATECGGLLQTISDRVAVMTNIYFLVRIFNLMFKCFWPAMIT